MRSSEWVVRILAIFLVLYCAIALRDPDHENFPFFAWTLFSDVPDPVSTTYGVRIVELDGQPVDPFFFEDGRPFVPAAKNVRAQRLTQKMGSALRGQRPGAVALRRSFERIYLLPLGSVEYEVVRRTFDLRRRFRCRDCYESEVVIGRYSVEPR